MGLAVQPVRIVLGDVSEESQVVLSHLQPGNHFEGRARCRPPEPSSANRWGRGRGLPGQIFPRSLRRPSTMTLHPVSFHLGNILDLNS